MTQDGSSTTAAEGDKESEGTGYFKAYEEYSRTLRTWLVAYGIGAPVLMLTNDWISATLLRSGQARCIAALFLAGVVLQVALAAVNKTTMWICYFTEGDDDLSKEGWAKVALWISTQYWIDLLLDLASLLLFAIATWLAFDLLLVSKPPAPPIYF